VSVDFAGGAGQGVPVLLGALSLDIYLGRDLVLPGGGALNMAWHWARAGEPHVLLSRVGDDQPRVFLDFLARHGIAHSPELVGRGASASIDIVIQPDHQPYMDHFVEGVWTDFACTKAEAALVAEAERVHLVLVEGAIRELTRLAAARVVEAGGARGPEVSADFLGFRHYAVERFADTMRSVDIGFVGWPGAREDDGVAGIRDVAHRLGRLVVVTLGSQGVLAFDGRPGGEDRFVPVDAIPVEGTTVGCGDAFVAAFLAAWRRSRDVLGAVEAGKVAGAEATHWRRPLPDAAYGPEAVASLLAADRAAANRPAADRPAADRPAEAPRG
jgi:sugar/nucleoside kinase (ribokinase family)